MLRCHLIIGGWRPPTTVPLKRSTAGELKVHQSGRGMGPCMGPQGDTGRCLSEGGKHSVSAECISLGRCPSSRAAAVPLGH